MTCSFFSSRKNFLVAGMFLALISCKKSATTKDNSMLQVVTTTTMLTDLVTTIGGDAIHVNGLMGSGVDPHLYRASEGDVNKLFRADLVFYNGLHLEGKLVDIFEKMNTQNIHTVAVAHTLEKDKLIRSEYFASNYDPHIWFNIRFWKKITLLVINTLKQSDPSNASVFEKNGQEFLQELNRLEQDIGKIIEELPEEKRILVTAHDAFNYFGNAYGFEVVGLQGLSTATEAGVQDVQKLSDFIITHKIKAIFVESSVPRKTIEALQAAVRSKGHNVTIGGTLYSDALGNPGTPEGTYTGMFRYNVNTIVNALK
ncbi:metal ABC transporter solute-binding protein, Zn/Mn family [Ascidiimonas aurantiaca]|uniref:metal ABC transporter solute-binding protein, Zn/Mn family n=1 Tax=Ascidiimonas aurantiaca TaxID=1685432 RepID=UPI0030EE9ED5